MIILASTSPTRQQILSNAGVQFTVEAPRVDERQLAALNPQWSPQALAENLAGSKALDVSSRHSRDTTIGADQVLECSGVTFTKPKDMDDCRRQLQMLRGRTHHLISTVACASDNQLRWHSTRTATLRMRGFSDTFLDQYLKINADKLTSSVGGYQIESFGIQLFEDIQGDHFTILGLPLLPLLQYLRTAGELKT